MTTKQQTKEKLIELGMMVEAEVGQVIYGRAQGGGRRQEYLRRQLAHVQIPAESDTGRAYATLYVRADVEELKRRLDARNEERAPDTKSESPVEMSPETIDRIAEAVLARLGGK
jgi:hypothetical protein